MCVEVSNPNISIPLTYMKICPYAKNKIRNRETIIPDFLLFFRISLRKNHASIAKIILAKRGIIISFTETIWILFAKMKRIGNIANRKG